MWDINKGSEASVKFSEAHVENINDVRFATHPSYSEHMLISTADDGHFKIWDLRTNNFTFAHKASDESVCVGTFNSLEPNLFVVGGDSSGEI